MNSRLEFGEIQLFRNLGVDKQSQADNRLCQVKQITITWLECKMLCTLTYLLVDITKGKEVAEVLLTQLPLQSC